MSSPLLEPARFAVVPVDYLRAQWGMSLRTGVVRHSCQLYEPVVRLPYSHCDHGEENQNVRDLDRSRVGPAMIAWLAALPVMVLIIAVLGVYDLQRWLERWDYDRHLSD
jgi:hypothetical protein